VAALDGVGDGDAGPAGGVLNTALETGAAAGLAVLVALSGAASTPGERADGHGFALTVAAAAFVVGAALLARSVTVGERGLTRGAVATACGQAAER
jgi:hypothetical protein